jgi:hypothetical protein
MIKNCKECEHYGTNKYRDFDCKFYEDCVLHKQRNFKQKIKF